MGKTIRFNENGLIAIKKRLNEIMVGIDDVSHNDVCVNEEVGEEFAPVTTIGDGGNNPPVGGNHYGIEQENIDKEVSSSEVDLSSFKKRDTLPPGIWKDEETLDSRVRLKLLDIADDFWEFINLSWVEPKGIIITGSICNFNWSKFSDIDLHIIADFKEIDEKTEFVKQYVDSKKNEWNNEHEGLKIMGFPVELYVQDVDDDIEAGGIYDLEENAWVRRPNPHSIKSIGLNKFSIKDKAAEIMTIIDDMYDKLSSTDDGHEIEQIGDDAHYLWDKVKDLRKKSLSKNGESGSGNIVYKVLRRTGYLDKLFKLFSTVYDRNNSITESKSNEWDKIDYFEKAKQYFGTTNDLNECGFILPNGEMLDLSSVKGRRGIPHRNVEAIGVGLEIFIEHGAIRCDSRYKLINICKKPTKEQINRLVEFIKANDGSVSLDLGNGNITFDYVDYKNANYKRIINDIINFFDNKIKPSSLYESKEVIKEYLDNESMKKYLTVLKEEVALDGSTEDNPYEKRWKAEREALKSFVANYGKLMQSKEDNKGGKLYKVYFDETMSNLIGYNYCICVQWNEQEMKPGSTVYIRALDKFTPFIRRDLQFDTRGRDNMRGTYDDTGY